MNKEMLINTVEGQECRIAILSNQGLEELYVERTATASHVGNIYKARVINVESSIQAAFVDAGLGRNGFLHISDINPTYFPKGKQAPENVGRKRPHYVRPPIQDCLRRGQEVVIQMTKEGIGTKGPTMTTYLSIPGRMLVMMPGMSRLGVSRKVEDDGARKKARSILSELKLPPDIGFIVRTAGIGRAKRDVQRDLNYLLRLWKSVEQRIKNSRCPAEIYEESDFVTRTIRDVYNSDISRILCDSEAVARNVKDFLSVALPRTKHTIELYTGKQGLFYDRGLEEEIEKIHSRTVALQSGGSLVIDQTEALVAIDVNSGRSRQHSDAETTALKTNLQAAEEVVRQLRLRDMGGVIVIDFIDMRDERNRRKLDSTLREAIKHDRAKTKVLRASAFGIIELTRQRLGPSLKQSVYDRCPHCDGIGLIKSQESLSLQVMRNLQRASANDDVASITVSVPPEVAHHLSNFQRRQLTRLESETGKTIVVQADPELLAGYGQIKCANARGSTVAWGQPPPPKAGPLSAISIDDLPDKPATRPQPKAAEEEPPDNEAEAAPGAAPPENQDQPEVKKRSRRGRRGGRKHRKRREEAARAPEGQAPETAAEREVRPEKPAEPDRDKPEKREPAAKPQEAPADEEAKPAKSKRSRRRGGRRRGEKKAETAAPVEPTDAAQPTEKPAEKPPEKPAKKPAEEPTAEGPAPKAKKRKRPARKRAKKAPAETEPQDQSGEPAKPAGEPEPPTEEKPKPARRKRATRKRAIKKAKASSDEPSVKAQAPKAAPSEDAGSD